MKITCSKSELRKFKVRAGRRYPQEYIETLWGLRDGWRGCDVLLIKVVPQKGNKHTCGCDQAGWEKYLEESTDESGLTFLGTIHTHNGNRHMEIPSAADNISAIESGERFFGIDCITRLPSGRLKHAVQFWFPQHPIKNTLK